VIHRIELYSHFPREGARGSTGARGQRPAHGQAGVVAYTCLGVCTNGIGKKERRGVGGFARKAPGAIGGAAPGTRFPGLRPLFKPRPKARQVPHAPGLEWQSRRRPPGRPQVSTRPGMGHGGPRPNRRRPCREGRTFQRLSGL